MDIVITYVNGLDPVWQKEYEAHTKTPIVEKRFRDWGTLKFLFRGIEKNMPFIRKVHLVVSGESQVPEWINRNEVNIVLHKDIIPAQFLPTFNCNPIEMHLHNIEGLDEEYLYFNDDIFPLLPCSPTDFFRNGKGVLGMSRHLFVSGMFRRICRNSTDVAYSVLDRKPSLSFLRPQHVCTPMLKSQVQEVYDLAKDRIHASMSTTRNASNLNQYLYLNYMYLKGNLINEKLSKKHFSVGIVSAEKLRNFIEHPTHKLTCINDVQLTDARYKELQETLLDAFNNLLPNTSKYEK